MTHLPGWPFCVAACGGCVLSGLRQTGEVGFALERQEMFGLVGEDVLAESRVEAGELLVDLGDALLGGLVEPRAGAHEVV